MPTVNKSIVINAPVTKVYTTARDPNLWHNWFIGLSEPKEVEGSGGVGTLVKANYLLAGMQFPVETKVLEDRGGPAEAYWKGKIEGPFAGEQTWSYSPSNGGTRVNVEMTYTIPGAALGRIANRLILERMLTNSLIQTLDNLKFMLEAE